MSFKKDMKISRLEFIVLLFSTIAIHREKQNKGTKLSEYKESGLHTEYPKKTVFFSSCIFSCNKHKLVLIFTAH